MLWQYDSVLGQQPTDLVDELRAAGDQPAADTMKALKILLLDRFLRNEAHLRSGDRLADRLGIVGIVLLRLHIRLDELRRHQSDRMPKPANHPCPIMRTSAGLDPNQARRNFGKEAGDLGAPQLASQNRPP